MVLLPLDTNQGGDIARKLIRVSDISGREIPEGKGVVVRATFEDARRGSYEIDVLEEEISELLAKGRKVARRGRRPKSEVA